MKIILAGLPGKIASAVAIRLSSDLLHPFALTSPRHSGTTWKALEAAYPFSLQLISDYDLAATLTLKQAYVALDFSPVATSDDRLRLWEKLKIPVVIGASGFDFEEARKRSATYANVTIFATNMALPIVALGAILKDAAAKYPRAFAGFSWHCQESHQNGKKDVSGTARSLLPAFTALGFEHATVASIESIREPDRQRAMGVPEDFLNGHGWHRYEATSSSGVSLALEHNVNGRNVYADGAIQACSFALSKASTSSLGTFDMIDVLAAGSKR